MNGTTVGTVLSDDGYLTLYEGIGKLYPFGTSYTPRNMIGSVLYEPVITDFTWNVSAATTESTDFVADRSVLVEASAVYAGFEVFGSEYLSVTDVSVEATATPSLIEPGGSSTLTSDVTVNKAIATPFLAGNSQNGVMFDVSATNALSITGVSVNTALYTATSDLEVLYRAGTFVGSEANTGAWTSVGTVTGIVDGASMYIPFATPLQVAAGQTMGLYVTRTDGGDIRYTSGTLLGATIATDGNLTIKEGIGIVYPFGTTYSPRAANAIVHYEIENPSGSTYAWAPGGGSGASQLVSPTASVTEYSLSVTVDGCEQTADVTVTVNNVGVEEEIAKNVSIYPNPANERIFISMIDPMEVSMVTLMDLSGKTVYSSSSNPLSSRLEVPVSNLAKGMYMLQIEVERTLATYRVVVQ